MKISLLLATLLLTTSLFAQNSFEDINKEIKFKTELLEKDLERYKESIRDENLRKQKIYESKINRDYEEIIRLKEELQKFS